MVDNLNRKELVKLVSLFTNQGRSNHHLRTNYKYIIPVLSDKKQICLL
jgi:hypothetical protein